MGQQITLNLAQKWTLVRTCDECERARHVIGIGLRASCTKCKDVGYLVRAYQTRAELVALDDLAGVTAP